MKRTILCICEGSSWHLHYLEDTHRIETLTGETSHFGGKRHVSILGPIKMPIARKRLGGFRESRYVRYQLKCAFLETWRSYSSVHRSLLWFRISGNPPQLAPLR